ncbi:MAG: hypothetical protein QF842_07020 [Candidatus Marinimicrobia bacterium]|nr:hypothetical protein [Candidatus Neomarinimicrobiota bacterium]
MVSFHRFSYSEVYRRGEVQSSILDTLIEIDPSGETIDESLVEKMLK